MKTANEMYKSEENMNEEAKMDAICMKLGIDAQKSVDLLLKYKKNWLIFIGKV